MDEFFLLSENTDGSYIELRNPVIYIFLNDTADGFASGILDFFSERLKNINALGIIDTKLYNEDDNSFLLYLTNLQKEFMTIKYEQTDYRRIYFVFDLAKDFNCDLEKLLDSIISFFTSFNMISLVDVFATYSIYDKNIDKEANACVEKNLMLLEKLYDNKKLHMAYILSDVNNHRVRTEFLDIVTCICFCTLIKDCLSNISGQDYTYYNERNFIENVQSKMIGKNAFYTLGFKKMDVLQSGLIAVVISSIINKCREVSKNSFDFDILDFEKNEEFFKLDDIYALMLSNRGYNFQYFTKDEVIRSFFGDRADLFFEFNINKAERIIDKEQNEKLDAFRNRINSTLADVQVGMYNTEQMLMNFIDTTIKNKQDIIDSAINDLTQIVNEFKNQKIKLDNKNLNGLLGPKIKEYPYNVLYEYLDRKSQHFYILKLKSVLSKYEDIANEYILNIRKKDKWLNEFLNILKKRTESAIKTSLTIGTNFFEYYEKKTYEYLNSNSNELFNEVYKHFYFDDVLDLQKRLIEYANKVILSPGFLQNFHSEVYSRILFSENKSEYKNQDDVKELINKEIFGDRLYFLELFEINNYYHELICYITVENLQEFAPADKNVCYFLDKKTTGLNVVYFLGGVTTEDLLGFDSKAGTKS